MKMKFQLKTGWAQFSWCCVLLLIGSQAKALEESVDSEVVVIDQRHASSEQNLSDQQSDYIRSPADALRIDFSQIDLPAAGQWQSQPANFMQVIIDDENMYYLDLDGLDQTYTLDRSTLKAIRGEFNGFKLADRAVLVVGVLETHEKTGQHAMTPVWLGAVTFMPRNINLDQTAHQICFAYINDYGASIDVPSHIDYCQQAAEQGAPSSVTLLAEAHYHGLGVEQDLPKAGSLFAQAAASGHVHAQMMTYFVYVKRLGESSTAEQKAMAMQYLQAAADAGYGKAIQVLGGIQ